MGLPVRLAGVFAYAMAYVMLLPAPAAYGYSVLAHEAIVDSLWEPSIHEMLVKRFPAATPEELEKAHAFAYGGCILQDMGYYPFSSHLFSDLTHYVRSGDFIAALIRESQDIDEYAFALGALAHYAADNSGHRIATNLAVPILYPKLRAKFGKEVTYGDDPASHLRTDFAFDVLQVAHGRYAPEGYRAFIGFEVSKPVLERAFLDTYGLELKDVFGNLDLALGSFRYSVSSIIPGMTRVAWQLKKDEVTKEIPGMTKQKFLYNLSRSSDEKDWGRDYRKPGLGTRVLVWLIQVIPKVGPFKSLAFRPPTPEVEKMFMDSFNATVESYRGLLANVDAGRRELRNDNLDLGEPAEARKYLVADNTYDRLLEKLADHKFAQLTPDLRSNILDYYKKRAAPPVPQTKKESKEWAKVQERLEQLKQASPEAAAQP
jgi:hypothetical protein